ncbi:hypothetical protein LEL_01957 [Akanthomyces lecanii RCEF 1005]|uniref:Uncharacterized protein n=1 Tax=Akanthomyces lecanii RCEF 1005 TaxID=1081108 RepID=A0A162KH73_CORDF|nr:hypothetical protein LEL_01957 [Akanthomyces lecanii RCEF 1005]
MQLQDGEAALCSIVLALGSGFEAASCKPGVSSAEQRLLKLQTIWLYYRAIWHLKDAAKSPHMLQSDGILATTKLVQIYETVSTIFVRTTLSINEGDWRTVPWQFSSKDPKDILTDILHEIVSLLKRLNQLRAAGGSVEKRDELLVEAAGVKRALQLWFSDLPADAKVFDYTTNASVPSEIASDRQLSFLYLVTLYWVACMLIDTTAGFLELVSTDKERHRSVEAGHETITHSSEAAKPHLKTDKGEDDAHTECEMQEMAVLDASKGYAYKIAHTMHLMRGPQVGICFYGMCVVPISLAFSLLTALEPAAQMSEERQILSSSLAGHALYSWVSQFAEETENPMARLEHEKARRLRWWTKC